MPNKYSLFIKTIVIFSIVVLNLNAQHVIKGYITDSETGESLPAANLQIEGTLSGAITNQEGKFLLELKSLPASVLISYIGYESKRIDITDDENNMLKIKLKPVILEMDAIEVSAEDPAMNIMRKVIKKKQEWIKKLKTYQADAYSRIVLENDSGIVSIEESISIAYWDSEKGSREVIISRRQTNNMTTGQNFAAASYIPNFYDDDIEINGFKIIGVTHPDALDYYRFKLKDRRMRDDKIVYDIEVIPTSILQPTFKGMISVLDEDYALLSVDLRPNENILFPPPFQEWNLYYKQQFSNFGTDFWLPVDVRINGDLLIGFTGLQLPRIIYSQSSHLNDYEINVSLPDSLYKKDDLVQVDSTRLDSVKIFMNNPDVLPLTGRENDAYETIDSTMTIEKAFKPTGFLARFAEVDAGDADEDSSKSILGMITDFFGPELWYNRVDALHAGLNFKYNFGERFGIKILGAYNTGNEKWAYGGETHIAWLKHQNLGLHLSYYSGSASQYTTSFYPWFITSFLPLFAKEDYYDYYWREHFRTGINFKLNKTKLEFTAGFNHEKDSDLKKTTDWNILDKSHTQRENPAINTGTLQSLDFKIAYNGDKAPYGLVGSRYAEINIEHSSTGFINIDFDFTRSDGVIEWRFNTFLKRRILPNALDFKLVGGYSTSDLPLQRYGALNGNLYIFSPFGSFRTLNGQLYRGEKYAAVFWEHNFRTAPFELIGLRSLAKKGIGIIIHGAHGRTWISEKHLQNQQQNYLYTDKLHHEIGITVNGLIDFLRFDMTQRLDQRAFYIGISLARIF
ncbi:MAG: DUF5686 family protein [Calditrichaceae bacterium]